MLLVFPEAGGGWRWDLLGPLCYEESSSSLSYHHFCREVLVSRLLLLCLVRVLSPALEPLYLRCSLSFVYCGRPAPHSVLLPLLQPGMFHCSVDMLAQGTSMESWSDNLAVAPNMVNMDRTTMHANMSCPKFPKAGKLQAIIAKKRAATCPDQSKIAGSRS